MTKELNSQDHGLQDEASFEDSLIVDIDSQDTAAQTKDARQTQAQPIPASDSSMPAQPTWIGKRLGHFKLLRIIGKGTMGCVIQALDVNLQRIVALKVLRKRVAGVGEQQKVIQFLREARAAAKIEHPNVVRIYEINQHDGWWYIAMEMLEGQDLRKLVKAVGSLPAPRACALIADAATALAVAHDLGIIHRDIKPTNLMLTRQGRCKLTDFGLVRVDDPNDPFDFTNKVVGSPQFIAPEMIRRRPQTPAIDVYSLGSTLYYALIGSVPYTGRTLSQILKQHLETPPPDLRKRLPQCPDSLALLVQRAMAKEPADRPTAADLAVALRAESIARQPIEDGQLEPGGSTAITAALKSPPGADSTIAALSLPGDSTTLSRHRWAWICVAAAVLIIGSLFLAYLFRNRLRRSGPEITPDSARVLQRFPNAPQTYGTLPPNVVPHPTPAFSETPPFSWVGKADVNGCAFVASKQGRHFYHIDSHCARFISLENFVAYRTAKDALADGKLPLP
jgi:serine/threonine-protein kinase